MIEIPNLNDGTQVLRRVEILVTISEHAAHFVFAETGATFLAGRGNVDYDDYYRTIGRWLCENVGTLATADLPATSPPTAGRASTEEEGQG